MTTDPSPTPPALPSDDQAAIDLLIEAGGDPQSALRHAPHLSTRINRAADLLRLLDLPKDTGDRDLLVNLTYLRILRDRDERFAHRASRGSLPAGLSDADAQSIDELVALGWDAKHAKPRSSKAVDLLALLDCDDPIHAHQGPSLIDRTMSAVAAEAERSRKRLRLHPVDAELLETGRRSVAWRDLIAVAAMVMLGLGVVLSVVDGARFGSQQLNGASGLSRASLGFGLFANDHDGHLPVAHDSGLAGRWWEVGNADQSHSAHLYLLVRQGYTSILDLASPGNPNARIALDPAARDWATPAELSYSMQLYGTRAPRLNLSAQNPTILLADRSPVIDRARRGEAFDPTAGSSNFRGVGQNALFSDGSVLFLRSPILENGDNIWLPRQAERGQPHLTGREAPAPDGDIYLGP